MNNFSYRNNRRPDYVSVANMLKKIPEIGPRPTLYINDCYWNYQNNLLIIYYLYDYERLKFVIEINFRDN